MANRKKQATLFNFGFSRRASHRGESYDLGASSQGPSFVEDANVSLYRCQPCGKHFKSKAGLKMHETWCTVGKKDTSVSSEAKFPAEDSKDVIEVDSIEGQVSITVRDLVYKCVSATEKEIEKNNQENDEKEKKDGRKGAEKRRSYTIQFKSMVANEAKHNPISDVALKYGIDKSMVTKWKKDEKRL